MTYDSLPDALDALSASLDAYRGVIDKGFTLLTERIDAAELDTANLRDELHEQTRALSNRMENLTRGLTTQPAETAERIVRGLRVYDQDGEGA